MDDFKAVAVNQSSHLHYNDHLAPIAIILGIPLMLIDEETYDLTRKFYPELDVQKVDFADFTPEYLIQNFDALVMSDLWDRKVFKVKFDALERKYNKTLRNVHVPHGFSDKGFYLRKAANEDITLVYGENMLDQFKSEGVFEDLNQIVRVGNYRYTYYLKHQDFFNQLAVDEIISKFPVNQKIMLYAPTWVDLEESSTFFDSYNYILDSCPNNLNLIVKLHPQLELDDTGLYYQIMGKYANHPNIQFVTQFPLIYPLLYYTDIYLGDMSSIGYDFLIFDRPMFFLNKHKREASDRRLLLAKAGVTIFPENYNELYTIIDKSLEKDYSLSNIRKELYRYTFGDDIAFDVIKKNIILACQTTNF